MGYDFDWVDAFTTSAFGGNPCVVVHGADALDEAARLALVRETSLSECAYVVASDVADFGARYYLATREIPMAGHPTIATVASLIDRGLVGPGRFTLEVGAGVLPIEVIADEAGPVIAMTQPAPVFGARIEAAEIAPIYGLAPEAIVGTPQIVSTGTPFCITVLADHAALRGAVLDVAALGRFQARWTGEAVPLMEPFLVTRTGASPAGDTFARLLLAPPLPPEDPFTGSATGCMAAYLWHHGLIERPDFVAEQGHWMDRPGQAEVSVQGPPGAITGVRVAGRGRVLMRGVLDL